ncbi:MAG: (d)CMP kinase [Clostridiales bacterium]|nr:(d)CMP kinase [Clostridiales bacterium]
MINVAVDGPAGAGKSTVSKRAAAYFGYIYVDTGALYRAVGLNALRLGINTRDAERVAETLKDVKVSLGFKNGEQRVFLFDEDVSDEIRTPAASMAASDVSAVPAVRDFLFSLQKDIAKKNNCIMDGRDIGTVVLPDAKVKIFLTASPEKRAERRVKELREKGRDDSYEDVLKDIIERDHNDSHRAVAPLKQADDAVLVDTSDIDFEGSVNTVINIIKEKTR